MNNCPIAKRLDGDFSRLFQGTPEPQRPVETERQYDQRVADELRAARRAAAERVS